jgi:hypothetical protein
MEQQQKQKPKEKVQQTAAAVGNLGMDMCKSRGSQVSQKRQGLVVFSSGDSIRQCH